MASEASVSDSGDPLSVLNGPSIFLRTIRASADAQVPADCKDLDSIHNFVKSLDLRSPEKLKNEAKKIVDGGAEFLESHLASFAGNMGISTAVPAKAKYGPQERRPGLGLARKRAPFSLRTTTSMPFVTLETATKIDNLEDPDEFFDAYERMENAKKEIQRQLGGNTDNLNIYEPSNNARPRRRGILGKTYNYKHRYTSTPSENNDMSMLSQDMVDQDNQSAPNDESQENLRNPNPDVDMEDDELAVPSKKIANEVDCMLEELLSHNNEDLEGDGALNLLQDLLNIKPLDKENLYMSQLTDVGKNNSLTVAKSVQKSRKSSFMIDNKVKESLNMKMPMERELTNPLNLVSSPTPPRSPFGSLFLLKTKILQSSPLKDPFSPLDVDLCAPQNASPCQHKDVLRKQVDAPKGLGISSELESHVDVDNTDPIVSNMDTQAVMGNADGLADHREDESVITRSTLSPVSSPTHPRSPLAPTSLLKKKVLQPNPLRDLFPPVNVDLASCRNASPCQPKDKLIQQVNASKDLGMSSLESQVEVDNEEPRVSNMDVQEVVHDEGSHPEQHLDDNISVRSRTDSRPREESDNNIEKTMNINEMADDPNLAVLDNNKAPDGATTRKRTHSDKQSRENQAKLVRGNRGAVESRIRKSHPMRKSLAESGTSFETGARRSKRIKMRPLEYWKGERFLYGHVDDSLKLLGVKYMSPGKDNENLKVKPYILSESSKYKELLDLAAGH